ncbi:MAG: hypothetical protein PVJ64_11145 [Gemmatimonadales bacterium]|jgi:uncharacterized integral membrane protein
MIRIREIGLMILTAVIIVFAAQNLVPVPVVFLVWDFEVSIALISLVPLLAGLLIGVGSTAILMRRRRRRDEPESEEEAEAAEPEPDDDTASETEDEEQAPARG